MSGHLTEGEAKEFWGSARQEKVREALTALRALGPQATAAAALAEVEEWEALLDSERERQGRLLIKVSEERTRAEVAEAEADRLKAALTGLLDSIERGDRDEISFNDRVGAAVAEAGAALAPADRNTACP